MGDDGHMNRRRQQAQARRDHLRGLQDELHWLSSEMSREMRELGQEMRMVGAINPNDRWPGQQMTELGIRMAMVGSNRGAHLARVAGQMGYGSAYTYTDWGGGPRRANDPEDTVKIYINGERIYPRAHQRNRRPAPEANQEARDDGQDQAGGTDQANAQEEGKQNQRNERT